MVLDVSVMLLIKAAMDVARSGVTEVGSGVGTASVGAIVTGAIVVGASVKLEVGSGVGTASVGVGAIVVGASVKLEVGAVVGTASVGAIVVVASQSLQQVQLTSEQSAFNTSPKLSFMASQILAGMVPVKPLSWKYAREMHQEGK